MAFYDLRTISVHGRRLGLQIMSTGQSGGRLERHYLVGPEALRWQVTTNESTGTNLDPFGISILNGTSAASSAVYTLDPPIPGVYKLIVNNSTDNGPMYIKTKNNEKFNTTVGTSFTVIKTSAGGCFALIGLTTALWAAPDITSGTSSNASGYTLSTTT